MQTKNQQQYQPPANTQMQVRQNAREPGKHFVVQQYAAEHDDPGQEYTYNMVAVEQHLI